MICLIDKLKRMAEPAKVKAKKLGSMLLLKRLFRAKIKRFRAKKEKL